MAVLGFVFLFCFVYALVESRSKWKATFMILGSLTAFIGFGALWGFVNHDLATAGTLTGLLCPFFGIAASIVIVSREKKAKAGFSKEK